MATVPQSRILRRMFASGPTDLQSVPAVIIRSADMPDLRIVHSYENLWLPVDGQIIEFEAAQFSLKRPDKGTSGAQRVGLGFAGITAASFKYVSKALEERAPITLERFEFIGHKDGTYELGSRYKRIETLGGQVEGDRIVIEAAYNNILTAPYANDFYNSENAPGIRFA